MASCALKSTGWALTEAFNIKFVCWYHRQNKIFLQKCGFLWTGLPSIFKEKSPIYFIACLSSEDLVLSRGLLLLLPRTEGTAGSIILCLFHLACVWSGQREKNLREEKKLLWQNLDWRMDGYIGAADAKEPLIQSWISNHFKGDPNQRGEG